MPREGEPPGEPERRWLGRSLALPEAGDRINRWPPAPGPIVRPVRRRSRSAGRDAATGGGARGPGLGPTAGRRGTPARPDMRSGTAGGLGRPGRRAGRLAPRPGPSGVTTTPRNCRLEATSRSRTSVASAAVRAWLTTTRSRGGAGSLRNRPIAACASASEVGSGVVTITAESAAAASLARARAEARAGVHQHEVRLRLQLAQLLHQPRGAVFEDLRARPDRVGARHDPDRRRGPSSRASPRVQRPASTSPRSYRGASPQSRSRFARPMSASITRTLCSQLPQRDRQVQDEVRRADAPLAAGEQQGSRGPGRTVPARGRLVLVLGRGRGRRNRRRAPAGHHELPEPICLVGHRDLHELVRCPSLDDRSSAMDNGKRTTDNEITPSLPD